MAKWEHRHNWRAQFAKVNTGQVMLASLPSLKFTYNRGRLYGKVNGKFVGYLVPGM
jgi:hypothetical protein